MRVVVDTNVLVSGLLNAEGPPGLVVNRVLSRAVTALYDSRMLAEYREVLARPRLRIPAPDADGLCLFIEKYGERVEARPVSLPVPDPDDLPFIEVALSGAADALVTGNTRHFSGAFEFKILSPSELIELLEGPS